jgi:hypothetical protein
VVVVQLRSGNRPVISNHVGIDARLSAADIQPRHGIFDGFSREKFFPAVGDDSTINVTLSGGCSYREVGAGLFLTIIRNGFNRHRTPYLRLLEQ